MKLKISLAPGLLLGSASPQMHAQPAQPPAVSQADTAAQVVAQARKMRDKEFAQAVALLDAALAATPPAPPEQAALLRRASL